MSNTTRNFIRIAFEVDADGAEAGRIMDDLVEHIRSNPKINIIKARHQREVEVEDFGAPPTMERQSAAQIFPLPTEAEMEAARAAFPGVDDYEHPWEEGGEELAEEMETATASDESEEEESDDEEEGYPTASEESEEEESDDEEGAATGGGGDPYQNCSEEGRWCHLHSQIGCKPGEVMRILQEWKDAGRIHAITGLTSGGSRKARAVMYKRALRTEGVYRDEGDEKGYLRWDGDTIGFWNKALKSFIIPPTRENVMCLQKFLSDQNRDPAVC